MQLTNVEPAVLECKTLLDQARKAGSLIIHVRHDAGVGSPYDVSADIGQICSEVAPLKDEVVITKNYPNSFVGTELEKHLKEANIENVVIAGFMTHMCVNSTARGAFNLGFKPTIVAKSTATRSIPGPDGSVVSAESLQAATLAGVADMFAIVVNSASDLKQ